MQQLLYILILLLGTLSYAVGIWQMTRNAYAPSVFSRFVWLLLAINSFAGVLGSKGSTASVLLAGVLLLGNAGMCLVSFWKGTREFGKLEYFCVAMLILSGIVWIVFDAPMINLVISLLAHFIGALPTYAKVWRRPASESTVFWSLFFVASVLSIVASYGSSWTAMLLPIYYALFDGSIFILSLRAKDRRAHVPSYS